MVGREKPVSVIQDTRFYYFRDAQKRPMVTLCRVTADDGRMAYAWAICSPTDNPHKEDAGAYDWKGDQRWHTRPGGKDIAKGRAVRALRKGVDITDTVRCYGRPIQREEALLTIIECQAEAVYCLLTDGNLALLPPSMRPKMEGELHGAV